MSLIAVVALAVGMAFFGTFLSLYVDLVLRPHPGFQESGQIATVGANDGRYVWGLRYGIVENMAGEIASIEAAAIASPLVALVGPGREESLVELASAGLFSTLRPRLILGRGFQPEDHAIDAEPVAVISYRYWQQQLGGNQDVLGALIEVARRPGSSYLGPPPQSWSVRPPEQDSILFRVIGVMTESVPALVSFQAGAGPSATALWIPLERSMSVLVGVQEGLPTVPGTTFVRLRPGVSTTAFESEFRRNYESQLDFQFGTRLEAIEGVVRNFSVQRATKRQLELFLAGTVLLALVAAANASLYFLARTPGRRRELGIRLAVGAPVRRLARQLATESALLVVVATTLGLFLSVWLRSFGSGLEFLREAEFRDVTLLDWRALSLTGGFLVILTLVVSLAPILEIKRLGIASSTRQVMARASLPQRIAVTAQMALAGALGGAGIAIAWHVGMLAFGDPGYETASRYVVDGMRSISFLEAVRQREAIEAIPGVIAVGFGRPVPGDRVSSPVPIEDPRDSLNEITAYRGVFDRAFIGVLGLELLHGRVPEGNETGTVVVNQTLARMLWDRDDVVGEHLSLRGQVKEVTGVLRDLSFEPPSAPMPYVFLSLGNPPGYWTVIHAELSAAELREALDGLVAAGSLEAWTVEVRSLKSLYNDLIAADWARGLLTITTATLVVLLAAFGCYGTQRYLIAEGRLEYAIRTSVGAGPKAVGRLVVWRGFLLGLPGLVIGGLLAFNVVAWLRGDFLGRETSPALVTISVVAGLALLLLAASLGPARDAKRTAISG